VARKRVHKKTPFANWLTDVRTRRAKLTQPEAVKKMKRLKKGVSVGTWSRWESGVRPVPENKIDAVADALGVSRKVARRQAGYSAPISPKRIKRGSVLDDMLRVLSGNFPTEIKVLRIYALGSGYLDNTDPKYNFEDVRRAARLIDDLRNLSPAQRVEAWDRIGHLFAKAKRSPATNSPVEKATIIFPKQNSPVVTLGTRVIIEHPEELQEYEVKKIEERHDKLVVKIVSTDS
jgi:transcriptional regulator with XRE-family HTH domain